MAQQCNVKDCDSLAKFEVILYDFYPSVTDAKVFFEQDKTCPYICGRHAAVAAFRELGEHLAVIEGERLLPGRGLNQTKQSLEHDAIKLALENANGSVTHPARTLGISFQALTYMLETRHTDLLKERTPVRRRKRKE